MSSKLRSARNPFFYSNVISVALEGSNHVLVSSVRRLVAIAYDTHTLTGNLIPYGLYDK